MFQANGAIFRHCRCTLRICLFCQGSPRKAGVGRPELRPVFCWAFAAVTNSDPGLLWQSCGAGSRAVQKKKSGGLRNVAATGAPPVRRRSPLGCNTRLLQHTAWLLRAWATITPLPARCFSVVNTLLRPLSAAFEQLVYPAVAPVVPCVILDGQIFIGAKIGTP